MDFHPAADIFPMLEGDEFDAFVQDIKEHGLKEPIVTYKGKIIDGRNRFKACRELNIKPIYTEWDGEGTITEMVVSLNLHRRHLSTNQRAMLGVKIQESLRGEAKDRMMAGVANPSKKSHEGPNESRSSARTAAIVKTSAFPVEKAAIVCDHGIPELIEAVQADQVAVHNAAEIARLPKDEQRTIVAQGPEAMLEKAKELRDGKKAEKSAAKPASEPIAARGLSSVAKRMDDEVEKWAKSREEWAGHVFDAMVELRKDLIGR
jgi:hypothetical protein